MGYRSEKRACWQPFKIFCFNHKPPVMSNLRLRRFVFPNTVLCRGLSTSRNSRKF
jgi:hypothetical protein